MRTRLWALLLATLTLVGCERQPASSGEPQSLSPAAWRKQFADSPSFFMAADGQMVFADSAAATKGIHDLALDIKQIELVWGDTLRVDPLMTDLAVVAASYREVRVNTTGLRVEDAGFFTGIAEYRNGLWQLRDCHWSTVTSPPPAPQQLSR